jgi:membrane-associated phospholipid phosphatase
MNDALAELGERQHRWRWWHCALFASIILMALAPFDLPVARLCYSAAPPRIVIRAFELFGEIAGTGLGVILLLISALLISRTKLSRVPLLLSIAVGGGLLADVGKMCVSRDRPHSMDLSVDSVLSTFNGLFPFLSAHSGGQSFPSGHAATAAGLAIALTLIYPRGRSYFAAGAGTVAVSRVVVHAHFPTDVIAGAMLGGMWGYVCLHGFLAPRFARIERAIDEALARRKAKAVALIANSRQPSGTDSDHRDAA